MECNWRKGAYPNNFGKFLHINYRYCRLMKRKIYQGFRVGVWILVTMNIKAWINLFNSQHQLEKRKGVRKRESGILCLRHASNGCVLWCMFLFFMVSEPATSIFLILPANYPVWSSVPAIYWQPKHSFETSKNRKYTALTRVGD